MTLAKRLEQHSIPEPNSGCLLWTASGTENGYGVTSINHRTILAHRAAWIVANGAIPEGMKVLHRCDVRSCINPAHLFLGTHADNMADMTAKGRAARRSGESASRARLTAAQAMTIYLDHRSHRTIARDYGVAHVLVGSIKRGESWATVTGHIARIVEPPEYQRSAA